MRKPVLLATMVVMLAALAAVTSDSARAEKPVGHVSGSFTAEYMGRQSVGGPIVRLGAVRITVNAHDRDPATDFACPSCPGLDSGAIVQTYLDGLREGQTDSYPVTNVVDQGGQVVVYTGTASIFYLYDGGSPGHEVVAPANPQGLLPTRDWYEEIFWTGSQHITGYLLSGNLTHVELPD